VPKNGQNIELGFEGDEDFPDQFIHQTKAPFIRK
jgi:hypothetical protein